MRHLPLLPKPSWPSPAFLLLAAALTAFALWGAAGAPFHPDESTALFMSADFEQYWRDPLSLAWAPGQAVDLQTHYRLLDAPLSRQIIGLARLVRGLPALAQDWRWDQSWEWNRSARALPTGDLLATARLANTLLLPFSLLFLYLTGRRLGGEAVGLGAALLLGLNALALLHARRAMMEAALLLGTCFALWTMVAGRRAWLVGLALALAFNAKQSAVALLPVGLLAVAWPLPRDNLPAGGGVARRSPAQTARAALPGWAQMLAVFAIVSAALNPVFWKQPLPALREALALRGDLAARQAADVARLAPEKRLDGYGERAAALLINLYMTPPVFSEYGNYSAQTAPSEQAYLAVPGHALLRGVAGGAALLGLTLLGLALSALKFRRADARLRRSLTLAWVATAALAVGLVIFFPFAWQRYAIPLVPLACLWAAFPLSSIRATK